MRALERLALGALALFVADGLLALGILCVFALAVLVAGETPMHRLATAALLTIGSIGVLGLTIDRAARRQKR